MVSERPGLRGGAGREQVGIERQKERSLIDKIMSRIAHEPDAVEQPSAGEFGGDNDGVQPQCETQAGLELVIGGEGRHIY